MRTALFILNTLDDRDIIRLAEAGRMLSLADGERLIRAGHEVHDLYFVADGTLAVVTPDGHRVAALEQGDVAGEMSFVEKRLPAVSVQAAGPARVLAIARSRILAEFDVNEGFAARFYRALAMFLSDRLRTMTGGATPDNEIDDAVLDSLSSAGEAFVRLLGLAEGKTR